MSQCNKDAQCHMPALPDYKSSDLLSFVRLWQKSGIVDWCISLNDTLRLPTFLFGLPDALRTETPLNCNEIGDSTFTVNWADGVVF